MEGLGMTTARFVLVLLAVLARGSGSHSGITSASGSYSGITSATAHSDVAGSEDVHDELLETVTEAEPISTASDPLSNANLDTLAREVAHADEVAKAGDAYSFEYSEVAQMVEALGARELTSADGDDASAYSYEYDYARVSIADIQNVTAGAGGSCLDSPLDDQDVSITGIVMKTSGSSYYSTHHGFYVQDSDAPFSGIYVYVGTGNVNVTEGDLVEVNGTVYECAALADDDALSQILRIRGSLSSLSGTGDSRRSHTSPARPC